MSGSRSSAKSCGEMGLPVKCCKAVVWGTPSHQRKQLCRGEKSRVKPCSRWGTTSPGNIENTEGRGTLGMTTRGVMRSEWDHELKYWKPRSTYGAGRGGHRLFYPHPIPVAGDPVLERSWVQKALGMFARSWVACPSKERKQKS